jgi:sarcosine oxidase subunit alpha
MTSSASVPSQPFRLPSGGRIDRSRPVTFSFDGKPYQGFAGDTLASALLANGVHMIARSFKYHRPRGIFGVGAEDPAGLVQIGRDPARTDPNLRATEVEIYDGLKAFPQNCWPSLDFDASAINDRFSRFLPAGFYYKTFMGPPGNWMLFERFIRAAAGLGRAPQAPDSDHYDSINQHCDVLVIGSGPGGLMAALTAARSGARAILAEETAHIGGALLSMAAGDVSLDEHAPSKWAETSEAELASYPEATILKRAAPVGYYGDNLVIFNQQLQDHLPLSARDPLLPRQRLWRIRAAHVVLAMGAIERPLIFDGNDRPGIMLASAVSRYIHLYGVLPGRNAVLFTNNNAAWQTAFDLHCAGWAVAAIVDLRHDIEPDMKARANQCGIPVFSNAVIDGTDGIKHVKSVRIRHLTDEGLVGDKAIELACDLLAVSGGLSPNVALFSQSRGKLRYDPDIAAFRPARSWQKEASAGLCNGTVGLAQRLNEGHRCGADAAASLGYSPTPAEAPSVEYKTQPADYKIRALWSLPSHKPKHKVRAFVDLQNDVTEKDLHLAVQEGYRSVEHAKRYTTTGMGTDQGKTVGINAFGIIADTTRQTISEVGVTTYRQPYKPVTFGSLAAQNTGALFDPRRTTPMHDWHVAHGAKFETVGDWLRARVYPRGAENFDAALMRECKAARQSIGVLDASTLGKIDVRGRDAREFLHRVYTNGWQKLKPGRCRYGLMLGEDGMVMDDGVTACLADDHFHMTTTTGGAGQVLAILEDYLQTEWPDLQVYLTSVTEQWAVASICGPKSVELVAALVDDLDPDPEKFPLMSWRDGHIGGVQVRVFRISFTGELSYEINIQASLGLWLWEQVFAAGEKYGIMPYGTEAMHLLRAEKGFIIVGQETDGTVTPHDLRMGWAVKKDGDFVGRRSLSRSDMLRPDRKQLVGLQPADPNLVLTEGAHIIATAAEPRPPTKMLGHVTSSYFSPALGRSFALALVEGGGARIGETLYATWNGDPPAPVLLTEIDFLEAAKAEQEKAQPIGAAQAERKAEAEHA